MYVWTPRQNGCSNTCHGLTWHFLNLDDAQPFRIFLTTTAFIQQLLRGKDLEADRLTDIASYLSFMLQIENKPYRQHMYWVTEPRKHFSYRSNNLFWFGFPVIPTLWRIYIGPANVKLTTTIFYHHKVFSNCFVALRPSISFFSPGFKSATVCYTPSIHHWTTTILGAQQTNWRLKLSSWY